MTLTPDPSASVELRAARQAMAGGDYRGADAAFVRHLGNAPEDAEVLAEYGVFCLRSGRADSACYLLGKADLLRPGQAPWLTQRGYAAIALNDYVAAQAHFMSAAAIAANDAATHYGLGLCGEHIGDWPAAARAFVQALAAEADAGNALPILLRLADACQRSGDVAAAADHFVTATGIAAHEPALWYAHARFLLASGQPAQAMPLIDRCGQRTPDEPRIVLAKAQCLRALGQFAKALAWLDRLQTIAPDLPEALVERGHCLPGPEHAPARHRYWLAAVERWIAQRQFAAARERVDAVLHQAPHSAAGWTQLGALESACDHDAVAEAAWRRAITCDAAALTARAHLALALERSNRLEDAAILADTTHIGSDAHTQTGATELRLLRARLARRRGDTATAQRELAQLDALPLSSEQRRHAAYERGKLLDVQGDAVGAMAAFTQGNALALEPWRRANPGRNKTLAGSEVMLELLRTDWPRTWGSLPALPAHRDIAFLIGFPRSGTTLLNQVLDTHPAICAFEEKPTVQAMLDLAQAMPGGYPQALARMDAHDVHLLRDAYERALKHHGEAAGTRLVLDKFPMNLGLAGLIHRVFPQARYVFALRHPCDVVLSCCMQDFQINNTMANFGTLADTVTLYAHTMDLWQRWRELLPLQVHAIRYEDVVEDFDASVRAVCAFLGVPWRDDLRDFSSKALARGRIDTPSYEQVSQPIYRRARGRWQRYRQFLEPHLPALQPYIERFGYATTAQTKPA